MDLKKLQERLHALVSEGEAIYAKAKEDERKLSDDEEKRISAIGDEISQCEEDIESFKKRSAFTERIGRAKESEKWLEEQNRHEPVEPESRTKNVEDRSSWHQWPEEHDGDFFRMIVARGKGVDLPKDIHEELRTTFAEQRAPTGQGTLIDSEGGFLVPEAVAGRMLQKIHSEGNIIPRAMQVPITVGSTATWNALVDDSRVDGSRYGGIRAYRTAEAGSITASTVATEGVKMELKKLASLVYLTEEQMEDGPQMLSLVNENVPKEITYKIEEEMFTGNGSFQMEGALNAPALIEVAKETGQSADTFLYENVVKMWARLYGPSRTQAAWFINQDVEPQLHTMTMAIGTGGVPVYLPAGGVSSSPYGTLFGRPVIPTEHNPTLGDKGDVLLADWSQYLYAYKGGLRRAQSMHVRFVQGETALRFTTRNDGKLWWKSALTPAKGSNTVSPFVTLAERA